MTKLGTTTFSYDGFGNRIAQNGILFTYDSQGNLIEQSNGLHFMYDHTGVMGFTYQGQTYFYQKDLQGNIVTIVNAAGAPVVQYYYDAWGNHKVYDGDYITEMTSPTFIGNLNPFRYRGYYYDSETGLYYLKSRCYDPEVGRFISADQVEYTTAEKFNGLNLYAYCNNNPVMFVDHKGEYVSGLTTLKNTINYIWGNIKFLFTNPKEAVLNFFKGMGSTIEAIVNSFVFECGVGGGFGGSVTICGIGVNTVAAIDAIAVDATTSHFLGTKQRACLNISITDYLSLGWTWFDDFTPYGEPLSTEEPEIEKTLFFGVSSSAYFGIGGSYSIGFDLDRLGEELYRIWGIKFW